MNVLERIIIGLLAVTAVGAAAAGITWWTERRRLQGMKDDAAAVDPHAEKLGCLRKDDQ